MTNKDISTETAPSPRLHRAAQMLENQTEGPVKTAPLNVNIEQTPGEPKQPDAIKAEIGGPDGPDPTRYGDWERNGRCIDF